MTTHNMPTASVFQETVAVQRVTKTLPIERMFRFDSTACEDCYASGQYAVGARCYSCNGLGRRFTVEVRSIIREVMAMLQIGNEALDSHGRWWDSLAWTIGATAVAPGMQVRRIASQYDLGAFDTVTRIEELTLGSRRFYFEGGAVIVATSATSFERKLTPFELDRCDVFMSQFVRWGVTEASEA